MEKIYLADALEQASYYNRILNTGNAIRPCIACMLTNWKITEFNDKVAIVVICELKHAGMPEERTRKFLNNLNRQNKKPLPEEDLQIKIKRSYNNTQYKFECYKSAFLRKYCIGKSCPVGNPDFKARKNILLELNELDWHKFLSDKAFKIYTYVLPILEMRKSNFGGRVIASYRQIAHESGIPYQKVGLYLLELYLHGLINFQPGESTNYMQVASTIQRVYPLPLPVQKYSLTKLELLKKEMYPERAKFQYQIQVKNESRSRIVNTQNKNPFTDHELISTSYSSTEKETRAKGKRLKWVYFATGKNHFYSQKDGYFQLDDSLEYRKSQNPEEKEYLKHYATFSVCDNFNRIIGFIIPKSKLAKIELGWN